MAYSLQEINYRTVADPAEWVKECDAVYYGRVQEAADRIIKNMEKSPIVLLSGPSGSGKTTTSANIAKELQKRGVGSHYIGMDDYYKTLDRMTAPRTPEGDVDFESPELLDMELMNEHFAALSRGESIDVPGYNFALQQRNPEPSKTVKLQKDEVAIFEGIHALNDMITLKHPGAFKLYISARSDVEFNGVIVFKRTWFRLVRRTVRDWKYRGTDPAETMAMWANVRRGEKANISPFKDKADFQFDTSLPYELAAMNSIATKLFTDIPEGIERYDELKEFLPALQLFGEIDNGLVPADSLIREFMGGGIYGD